MGSRPAGFYNQTKQVCSVEGFLKAQACCRVVAKFPLQKKGAAMDLKQFMEKHTAGRKAYKVTESAPLSFREMEHLLNSAAIFLFEKYRAELIERPPVYIVPAVWGGKEPGDLDATQKEIHRTLVPVLAEVCGQIAEFEPDSHEGRCIDYLLKGLVLYKMAYMVQYYMNKKGYAALLSMEKDKFLHDMEPVGRA